MTRPSSVARQGTIAGTHVRFSIVKGPISMGWKSSDAAVVRQHELSLKRLREERDRLSNERIAVQVVVEDNPDAYKQIFADIADNAKGMSGSVADCSEK